MPQDQPPTYEEFMDDMREKYPILFKGGAGCEEAIAGIVETVVNDVKTMLRQQAIQDVAHGVAVLLNSDLDDLQEKGLSDEDRTAFATNPDETLYGFLEETYSMLVQSIDVMGEEGIRLVSDDEPCDCPAHGGSGNLDDDFGNWDRKKMGQA